jgi:PilZ domain-containing protein
MDPLLRAPSFSRRRTSRVDAGEGVSVCWRSNSRDDVSSVRNLSAGGLFINTPTPRPVGATAKVDFLVQEGRIRVDATVRHVKPASGMGLQFTAVPEADRPRLGMLITRLRNANPGRPPAGGGSS